MCAHAGSRTRVTSMGGLYDAATLRALLSSPPEPSTAADEDKKDPSRIQGESGTPGKEVPQ